MKYNKKMLLNPEDRKHFPPVGLRTDKSFERLGMINSAVIQDNEDIDLYTRLIYKDKQGEKSCIVRNQCNVNSNGLFIKKEENNLPLEELIFQPESDIDKYGVEDFRVFNVKGDNNQYGIIVNYDGKTPRSQFTIQNKDGKWKKLYSPFPIMTIGKAIGIAEEKGYYDYANIWGKTFESYLGVKDCSVFPFKIDNKYAVIMRLFPDMQIAYINSLEDLSNNLVWEKIIGELVDNKLLNKEYD